MLRHQHVRIEKSYIPDLRLSLKECGSVFSVRVDNNLIAALSELSDLRKLAFEVVQPGQALREKHSSVLTKAYGLRKTLAVQELLRTSPHTASKTKKLWDNICFAARLRVALENFKKISTELPSFRRVNIKLVSRDLELQNPVQGSLTLKEVFKLLGLALNDSTIKAVVNQKWAVSKAEKEFATRQKLNLNVHAEVQMILFLSQDGNSFEDMFAYFGCSKYTCFMCSHFLKAYGGISTRGCHGRLFKPWTVPDALALGPGQAERIARAVTQLQKDLKKELKSVVKEMRRVKTSVVGGSSVFSEKNANLERRKKALDRRTLQIEQARIAERFKR
jgi:hypothetical protein